MIQPQPKPPLFPYTTLFRSPKPPPLVVCHANRSVLLLVMPTMYSSSMDWLHLFRTETTSIGTPLRYTQASNVAVVRSEEHTSELQSPYDLVCRHTLEKKNIK